MTLLPAGAETIEDLRKMAGEEYAGMEPAPEPPQPPIDPRPEMIRVGQARAWLEVEPLGSHRYGIPEAAAAVFYIVAEQKGETIRLRGEMEPEEIDDLISQLMLAREAAKEKTRFYKQDQEYQTAKTEWGQRQAAHVRQVEAEWQKAKKK